MAKLSKKEDQLVEKKQSTFLKHSFFGGFDSADIFLEQLQQKEFEKDLSNSSKPSKK